MSRETKKTRVLTHLKQKGKITSQDAIQLYGDTRLSDTIFKLRRDHDILTEYTEGKDRYGSTVRYATYIYQGEIAQRDLHLSERKSEVKAYGGDQLSGR